MKRSEEITEGSLVAAGEPQLHWVMPDNRPALRALARLVNIKAIMDDSREEALRRAQRLIIINPHDNAAATKLNSSSTLQRRYLPRVRFFSSMIGHRS